MSVPYKVGAAVNVDYRAKGFVTGLSDVTLKVYDPSETLFATVTLAEIVGQGGVYKGAFTPNAVGTWRIRITSIVNGDDVARTYEIALNSIDDLDAELDSIGGVVSSMSVTLTSVAGNVSTILTDVGNIYNDTQYIKNNMQGQGGYIL